MKTFFEIRKEQINFSYQQLSHKYHLTDDLRYLSRIYLRCVINYRRAKPPPTSVSVGSSSSPSPNVEKYAFLPPSLSVAPLICFLVFVDPNRINSLFLFLYSCYLHIIRHFYSQKCHSIF